MEINKLFCQQIMFWGIGGMVVGDPSTFGFVFLCCPSGNMVKGFPKGGSHVSGAMLESFTQDGRMMVHN